MLYFYTVSSAWQARRVLPAILIVAAQAVGAAERDDTQIWLNPGMFSHHFRQGDYREDNYGLGAEVVFAPRHRAIAGNFINSNWERSRYAGYHWLPWRWQPGGFDVGAGLILAMIDGYSNTHHGDWFPVVFPSLSAQYGIFGANLIFIPNSRNGSALALQLRLRVW